MKQHITIDQLDQLSESVKQKLREWCRSHLDYSSARSWGHRKQILDDGTICYFDDVAMNDDETMPVALLSIGQMIEFLDQQQGDLLSDALLDYGVDDRYLYPSKDFCDRLWSAVVEVLNKE